jgi:hypothetical protein
MLRACRSVGIAQWLHRTLGLSPSSLSVLHVVKLVGYYLMTRSLPMAQWITHAFAFRFGHPEPDRLGMLALRLLAIAKAWICRAVCWGGDLPALVWINDAFGLLADGVQADQLLGWGIRGMRREIISWLLETVPACRAALASYERGERCGPVRNGTVPFFVWLHTILALPREAILGPSYSWLARACGFGNLTLAQWMVSALHVDPAALKRERPLLLRNVALAGRCEVAKWLQDICRWGAEDLSHALDEARAAAERWRQGPDLAPVIAWLTPLVAATRAEQAPLPNAEPHTAP